MPFTALRSTSSASTKDWLIGVSLLARASRRWFGIVIRVSTTRWSSSSPWSAWRIRWRPSKGKGLLTTATVRAPTSRATSATTGAAPVPVPPPRPAVTNTMSEPISMSRSRSRSSMAAARPRSGLAPQPSPRVTSVPSWTLVGASLCLSAWASVFATTNSTPDRPWLIMVSRALPPAPPTPITLIRAWSSPESSNSRRSSSLPTSRRSMESSDSAPAWFCPFRAPRGSAFFAISHPPRSVLGCPAITPAPDTVESISVDIAMGCGPNLRPAPGSYSKSA